MKQEITFLLYFFRFVQRLHLPAPGTTAVPCKRVPRTRHIVSGTYIYLYIVPGIVSWIWYHVRIISDLGS